MKNKDLSNYIGNISLKYVEEAENFTARKMNLTKIVSLAACIALLITAIPATLILSREDEKEAPVVTTPSVTEIKTPATTGDKTPPQKDPEPYDIIYCGAETDEKTRESLRAAFEESSDKKVDVQEFVEYQPALYWKYEMLEYSEDIPKTLNFTLCGEEYNCTFDCVYNTGAILSTDETLKSYAKIARYNVEGLGDNGYERFVLYSIATKEIVKIVNSTVGYEPGDLSIDDFVSLAEKHLISLYGEDILAEYKLYNAVAHTVIYKKYVGEFETTEKIVFRFSAEGNLIWFEAEGKGMFDTVEKKVNNKTLLDSEAKYQKLSDGQLVSQKILKMGNDGKPYICATLTYEEDGRMKLSSLYYKVDIK